VLGMHRHTFQYWNNLGKHKNRHNTFKIHKIIILPLMFDSGCSKLPKLQ
jgi:hypothetical protein